MKEEGKSIRHIRVTTDTMIRALLIIAGAALLWHVRELLMVFLTALLVASSIEPVTKSLMRRGIPRVVSVVILYVTGIIALVGIVLFFVPAFIGDVMGVAQVLPSYLDKAELWNPTSGGLGTFIPKGLTTAEIQQNIIGVASNAITGGGVVDSVSLIFGGFLSFVLIFVISFYLAAQERGIENFLRVVSPIEQRGYVVSLWHRSQVKIAQWFQGQLILGLIIGVLSYLGLLLLGVPSALFLAVVTAVFELIPVFGPIMSAVPGIAIAFSSGTAIAGPGLGAGLSVALFYLLIQQFESHLIYPVVVRKVVGVPPLLVILALLVGAKLAGFLGILLSVPMAAVIMEYVKDVAERKRAFDDDD